MPLETSNKNDNILLAQKNCSHVILSPVQKRYDESKEYKMIGGQVSLIYTKGHLWRKVGLQVIFTQGLY